MQRESAVARVLIRPLFLGALLVSASGNGAWASSIRIACAAADALSGGGGPVTVTYDGEAAGTVTVASEQISFSLPAKKEVRMGELDGKPHSVTGITGFSETLTAMPEQAALEACAAKSVQPEFKDDADMVAMAVMSCVKTTPAAAAPVKAQVSVSVALVPNDGAADDVVVEIRRSYSAPAKVPGGKISIDTFPGNCSLIAP
jgi:hypothetical protein